MLGNKDGEVRSLKEHIRLLEDQVITLKRVSQSDRDELGKLRATVAALDREKDELQAAVDEKTEAEVKQQDTVMNRVKLFYTLQDIVVLHILVVSGSNPITDSAIQCIMYMGSLKYVSYNIYQ